MVILSPCFFSYEDLSLWEIIAISKCALFVECVRKNFLVEFQVQKTILLNTVAIQVPFKDLTAIFKRSKDYSQILANVSKIAYNFHSPVRATVKGIMTFSISFHSFSPSGFNSSVCKTL